MKDNCFQSKLVLLPLFVLLLFNAVCFGVDSDGIYVADWFSRVAPGLGYPVEPNFPWSGGRDNVLWLEYGVLKMNTSVGGSSQIAQLGDLYTDAWTITGSSGIEIIQLDFKFDDLVESANTAPDGTRGVAFGLSTSTPSWAFFPFVMFSKDIDDSAGTYSIHVDSAYSSGPLYHDEDGLLFGNWYRLTIKYDDTANQQIDYYLENLTASGSQSNFFSQSKLDQDNNATYGQLPTKIQLGLDYAVCSAEFDNIFAGEEGTRPVELVDSNASCGLWGYLPGDADKDCRVDINDLNFLAQDWLGCTNPLDANCGPTVTITLVEDDFETHTGIGSFIVASDYDPDSSLWGGNWSITEDSIERVQIHRSPVSPLSPYTDAVDTIFGDQFLHVMRGNSGSCRAWLLLDTNGQNLINNTGRVKVNFKVYNLINGVDSGDAISITGFDSPAEDFSNRAFDLVFRADGTIWVYDGLGNPTANGYNINSWNDVEIVVDFTTDTYSLTVNGSLLASGLGWAGGDLSKIQTVVLSAFSFDSGLLSRGGFDNLSIQVGQ